MKTFSKSSLFVALVLMLTFSAGILFSGDVAAALNRLQTRDERAVVSVVNESQDAVVSVIGSKEVAVFEAYQDQVPVNGFENFFFTIDRLRQVGTKEQEVIGGTGFFITRDGYLITSNHVVADSTVTYRVLTNDGDLFPVRKVFQEPKWDIALLKVEGDNFPVIRFTSTDQVQLGQTAIAIGNSLAEFKNTVSRGIVSGVGRMITADDGNTYEELIQTDAAINQGNSGGPLLNTSGELIGVNFSVVFGAENIGFAIPTYQLKQILYRYDPDFLRSNRRSSR